MERVEEVLPLTDSQQAILFDCITSTDPGVYVEQIAFKLGSKISESRLKSAWEEVYRQTPALRSIIVWDGLDQPLQIVRTDVQPTWSEGDWSLVPPGAVAEKQNAFLRADRARGLSLLNDPVGRHHFVTLPDDTAWVVWTFHHALIDGTSARLVLARVWEVLDGRTIGLPPPFGDYVEWLRRQQPSGHWAEVLAVEAESNLPRLRTPSRVARSVLTTRQTVEVPLGKDLPALPARVTPNTLFLTAWAIVLSRMTGSESVRFGLVLSGRPPSYAGSEDVIGMLVNTVPMAVKVDPRESSLSLLRAVGLAFGEALDNQYTFLSERRTLDQGAGEPGRVVQAAGFDRMFESVFVFQHAADEVVKDEVRDLRIHDQAFFPLSLMVLLKPEPSLLAILSPEIVDGSVAESILKWTAHTAFQLAGRPDQPVGSIGTGAPRSSAADTQVVGEDVLERILRKATSAPNAPALTCGSSTLTYSELRTRAAAVAAALSDAGVSEGDRVGILTPDGIERIASMLGAFWVGAAYVPLDPEEPEAWNQRLATTIGLRAVVGQRLGYDHVAIRPAAGSNESTADYPAVARVDPKSTAYILFTSGSTGEPKGVPVSRSNLAYSTAARDVYYEKPPAVFLLLSPFVFDSSVAGIYWTLTRGGHLVIPESGALKDADRLVGLIRIHGVTHTLCLPSVWRLILEFSGSGDLNSFQTTILAGERLSRDVAARHFESLGHARLFNEYGPTEGTVWVTVHEVSAGVAGAVPIGQAIPGTTVTIRDMAGHELPDGIPGEICIAGPGVVSGYIGSKGSAGSAVGSFNDASREKSGKYYRTGDRGQRTPDGTVHFLGRIDRQVKVRGHRIELDHIESALGECPGVRECAAIVREAAPTTEEIIAATDRSNIAAALDAMSVQVARDVAEVVA